MESGYTLWQISFDLMRKYENPVFVSWGAYIIYTVINEERTHIGSAGISGSIMFGGADLLIAQKFIEASEKDPNLRIILTKQDPKWVKKLFLNHLRVKS